MQKEEILENRRKIGRKLIEQIRHNNGKMIISFLERPYYAGKQKYKFSTGNCVRIFVSERNYKDPRWYKISDIQENRWKLKENAKGENLEEWQDQECFLTEFYNAQSIIGVEGYKFEEEKLNQVLEFLQMRGLIDSNSEIISLQDGIEAVVKYAETFGADELTKILVMQMWLTEIKIKTNLELFLPTYPEETLSEVAEKPHKIFESMNKAQTILKNLRQEKIKPPKEISSKGLFKELMVVYHGSEKEQITKDSATISIETILTGEKAYEFLFMIRNAGSDKIWLEMSYKDYSHGKFLIDTEDYELAKAGTVSEFLRKRLDRNRQQILDNPAELEKYIASSKMIDAKEILAQIKIESEKLSAVMEEFEQEEITYLEQHPEWLV